MPRWHLGVAIVFIVAFAVAIVYDQAIPGDPSGWSMLLWFALFPATFFSIIVAAVGWRTWRWRALMPSTLFVVSFSHIFWLPYVGSAIRDHRFIERRQEFETAISTLPRDPWVGSRELELNGLSSKARRCCNAVSAYRDSSQLQVVFFAGRQVVGTYKDSARTDGTSLKRWWPEDP
jgi:hypothetical protein